MNDKTNFNRIMAGLEEVADIVEGRAEPARVYVPEDIDVRAIRERAGLTQAEFASRYGFPLATVRDWEQKRRRPESAARVLLMVIDKEPAAVDRALGRAVPDHFVSTHVSHGDYGGVTGAPSCGKSAWVGVLGFAAPLSRHVIAPITHWHVDNYRYDPNFTIVKYQRGASGRRASAKHESRIGGDFHDGGRVVAHDDPYARFLPLKP